MVNSVAGGGTLLTFPALLWTGFTPVIANATSTVALWPGQLSSLLGYRKEIGQNRTAIVRLAIPSLLGGTLGAWLLLHTPHSIFNHIVPYLILLATALFMVQEPLARRQRARAEKAQTAQANGDTVLDNSSLAVPTLNSSASGDVSSTAAVASGGTSAPTALEGDPSPSAWAGIIVFQFLVAIYGGYFGAGIGIMMLATLGYMGFTNIHRMNGLKNINGLCINAVASLLFITSGQVKWHIALLMAAGSIIGGYSGAGTARRIGQRNVRRVIIAIGLALALWLLKDSLQAKHGGEPPKHASDRSAIRMLNVWTLEIRKFLRRNEHMVTTSGLEYEDVQEGTGPSPTKGQTALVHYVGTLTNGKKFDSSRDRGKPFAFRVGVGQVIAGWDEGVGSMKVGGIRKLIIPSALGYGAAGAGSDIPPHATLLFEVELIEIK